MAAKTRVLNPMQINYFQSFALIVGLMLIGAAVAHWG